MRPFNTPYSINSDVVCSIALQNFTLYRMMKFLSMLLAQILIPSTELDAYSRSSLWKPKSPTPPRTGTELSLVVYCFYPWFCLDARPSIIFTLLLGVAVVVLLFCTVFFFILYALCLANIGLMQCLALGSLLVHGRFCYIQWWCVCALPHKHRSGLCCFIPWTHFSFFLFKHICHCLPQKHLG